MAKAHISELSMSKGSWSTKNPRPLRLQGGQSSSQIFAMQTLACARITLRRCYSEMHSPCPPPQLTMSEILDGFWEPVLSASSLDHSVAHQCWRTTASGLGCRVTSMWCIFDYSPTWHPGQDLLIHHRSLPISTQTWPRDPSQCQAATSKGKIPWRSLK